MINKPYGIPPKVKTLNPITYVPLYPPPPPFPCRGTGCRTMVVRATHVLQPGEEVSVSYLGTEDHAPASMRRKVGLGWDGVWCNKCGAWTEGRKNLPSSS